MPPETDTGIPQADRDFKALPEMPPPAEKRELTPRQALAQRKREILDFGDIAPEDRKILEKPFFASGEEVLVLRSDGRVDSGWVVTTTTAEGRVNVVKVEINPQTGKKEIARKTVRIEKLLELNP